MEPTNQNTLSFMEHSSKKQDLTIQSVNAIVNPETKNDDTDLPKYDKSNISDACIKPLIMKQESILYNEMECKQDVKTDFDENICKKCQKKFKVIHYLRRHELTCGMTFHYNCLFCAKTSLLSHTIKCHMTNCHAEQVAVYGMKNAMNAVIKRRKENKEINMNVVLNKENQVLANIESYFIPMNNFENIIKNNKHEETISNDCKIKKELLEENYKEGEDFSNLQNNIVHINKTNIKPSKKYVEALCSNCNVYFTNLKSGVMKCCTHCQSPLIYKCAVCRKCFSKYLSICGHVKYHSKSNLCQIVVEDDKYYCGYCNYETIQKSQLLRHILEHGREKSVFKTKREYFK
ncbi:zinc finger X-chromosomal protein-like isoform X1 [Phymastichus coffea]|uniref:zinc finger X-chromosomal protein-like isoform X1 n=1 Tax=Phymastichus coffea TaxID=108790 RepID=UPI00273ADEBD|nr:zinc finger X-chromosomal protein-like isoform X1 [Phymastichus coffea]